MDIKNDAPTIEEIKEKERYSAAYSKGKEDGKYMAQWNDLCECGHERKEYHPNMQCRVADCDCPLFQLPKADNPVCEHCGRGICVGCPSLLSQAEGSQLSRNTWHQSEAALNDE